MSALTAPQSLSVRGEEADFQARFCPVVGSYLHVEEHQPHGEVAQPVHRAPHHERRGSGRLQEHLRDHHSRNGTCKAAAGEEIPKAMPSLGIANQTAHFSGKQWFLTTSV